MPERKLLNPPKRSDREAIKPAEGEALAEDVAPVEGAGRQAPAEQPAAQVISSPFGYDVGV